MSEVEKIWILYDFDENGDLDFEEISEYFKTRSNQVLSHAQLKSTFTEIDLNKDGVIQKSEMIQFLHKLARENKEITFKTEDELNKDFYKEKKQTHDIKRLLTLIKNGVKDEYKGSQYKKTMTNLFKK